MRSIPKHWLITAAILTPAALAQQSEEFRPPRADAYEATLQNWRAEHGENWRGLVDPKTGHLEMLFGGNALPLLEPDTDDEADWFALARHWVAETEGMHGISNHEIGRAHV